MADGIGAGVSGSTPKHTLNSAIVSVIERRSDLMEGRAAAKPNRNSKNSAVGDVSAESWGIPAISVLPSAMRRYERDCFATNTVSNAGAFSSWSTMFPLPSYSRNSVCCVGYAAPARLAQGGLENLVLTKV